MAELSLGAGLLVAYLIAKVVKLTITTGLGDGVRKTTKRVALAMKKQVH